MKSNVLKSIELIAIGIVLLVIGIYIGSRQEKNKILLQTSIQKNQSTKIAVVNQDEGVNYNNKYVNYAEHIISLMGENFSVVSRDIAKKGIDSGKYGAVITFPGNFSERVVTVNKEKPQKAQFYYELNKKLSAKDHGIVTNNIARFEKELGDKLSYFYMASILNEFHLAQNEVKKVLENDREDINNINNISDGDILSSMTFTDFEKLNMDLKKLDLSNIFQENLSIMDEMDKRYKQYTALSENELNNIKSDIYERLLSRTGAYSIIDSINEMNYFKPYDFKEESYKDVIEYEYNNIVDASDKSLDKIQSDLIDKVQEPLNNKINGNIGNIKSCIEEMSKTHNLSNEEISVGLEKLKQNIEELSRNTDNMKEILNNIINITIPFEKINSKCNYFMLNSKMRGELLKEEKKEKEVLKKEVEKFIDKIKLSYDAISEYNPLQNIEDNKSVFVELVVKYYENNKSMENVIATNDDHNRSFINDIYNKTQEHIDLMRQNMETVKKESDSRLTNGLAHVKKIKEHNTMENRGSMEQFSQRLPYTKIGTVDNNNFYDFVSSPLKAVNITQ